jgi:type I restriction enzyme S subunit
VLQAGEDVHPPFFRHYFKSTDFVKQLSVAVVGIRDGKQISYTDFRSIKLPHAKAALRRMAFARIFRAEQIYKNKRPATPE